MSCPPSLRVQVVRREGRRGTGLRNHSTGTSSHGDNGTEVSTDVCNKTQPPKDVQVGHKEARKTRQEEKWKIRKTNRTQGKLRTCKWTVKGISRMKNLAWADTANLS